MVEIGKYNTLKIVKDLDFGVYLDGGNGVEILLPTRYVPKSTGHAGQQRLSVWLLSLKPLCLLQAPL